jgi:hypothetical protein
MSYVKMLAFGLVSAVLMVGPQHAFAAETIWPLQAPATVLLGYGETYSGRTHSGIDLRAGVGDQVVAPCAANVAFAGRVPAGVGQTCLAVTLSLPDGRSMTFMPLASTAVAAGVDVGAGASIGEIASAGDGSYAESHLHIGLRRGETYLDPMTLLTAPASEASEPQSQGTSTAEAPVVEGGALAPPATAAPVAVAGAASAPTVSVASASPAGTGAPAPVHPLARGHADVPASAVAPSPVPVVAAGVGLAPVCDSATNAEPAPGPLLPTGVSLATSVPQARTKASAAAHAHGAPSADAVLKRNRAAVWISMRSTFAAALGVARAAGIELALVALGIIGATVRKRSLVAPAPASVRPVEHAIAAAAGRCYTRRAHFLLRAQPSQSRSRIVQGR